MAKDSFYIVNTWMIDDLGLSGIELQCFAIIWSLSRGEKQMYTAGISHLVNMTKKTKKTVITALKELSKNGLIKKCPVVINGVEHHHYKAIDRDGVKFTEDRCKNYTDGGVKITPTNIERNIESNNKEKRLSNDNQKADIPFSDFYELYPVKKSKSVAEKKWEKMPLKDKRAAIDRLPAYLKDCKESDRQIKHPSTYLNQRTWEDEFADDVKEEKPVFNVPIEDANTWYNTEKWMMKETPRIAKKVSYREFVVMRNIVNGSGILFAAIMKHIETSGYIGDDIVKEYERVSQLDSFSKRITT